MSLKLSVKETSLVANTGQWAVQVNGRPLPVGFDNVEYAFEEAQGVAATRLKKVTDTPQGDNIAHLYKVYLDDKTDDKTCQDADRIFYAWKALEPHFGDLYPRDVDRKSCRDYHEYREAMGVANSTINKELKFLRAALNFSLGSDHDGAMFEFLPEPEPRDRWLSREEFNRLLDACKPPHLRMFCHLAIATAARKAAIYELERHNVTFDNKGGGTISLGKKTNGKKRATVPMTKRLRKEIEIALESNETDFLVEYAGRPVKDVKNAFNRAVRHAGIEDFTIHDLRHTAAVWMCERGTEMSKISTYLGHTRIDITRNVYAKYQPEHLADAAAALEVEE